MADKAGVLVLTGSRHTAIGAPALRKRRWAQAPCRGLFLCAMVSESPGLFVLVREQMKMANTNTCSIGVMDAHRLQTAREMGASYALM
jgi:hypothetical protein